MPLDLTQRGKSDTMPSRIIEPSASNHLMKPAVLEVSDLTVRRGDTVLLDRVSWRVARGEHWVILGANGSGKTTLLNTLTGYEFSTSGAVGLLGERFGESDWRELRKQVGLVSSSIRQRMADDEPAIESVVSGRYAMIDFHGRVTPADRVRATRLLRQTGCAHLAARPWRVLSQGERQRVLIGRALMAGPRVLILDEPCAGLDPVAREHFLQFLDRLARRKNGPSLVLVTHHVEEILPAFSHVLVLKNGRVLASGKKSAVLTSRLLGEAFGTPVRLRSANGRPALAVKKAGRGVM